MGTSCSVAKISCDGEIEVIYGHWDGYPSGVGKFLLNYYNTQEMVDKLINLGGFSQLQSSIEKPYGHSFNTPVPGYSVFYGRDKGEQSSATQYASYEEAMDDYSQSYNYLWDGAQWLCNGELLTQSMCSKD